MNPLKIFLPIVTILMIYSQSFSQNVYTFNDGLNAANSGGKKIFLEIYSNSDKWCKKMDSEVYSSPTVQNLLSNFVFAKLNAEGSETFNYDNKSYSSSELAKLFGATGYPTFVFLNSDGSIIKFKYNGEEVSNLSGFIDQTNFVEMLNYFANNKYKDTDLSTIFQN